MGESQNIFEKSAKSKPTKPVESGTAPKKSKLGLILGLSIGGGILLIGTIVLVLLLVLGGGVSKKDYQEARDVAQDMASAYSKIGSVYVSSSSTETQVKNALDTIKDNRSSFDKYYEELGAMKAIKNDKEATEYYKALSDKKGSFDTTMDTAYEVYEKIYPVMSKLSGSSYSTNYNDLVKSRQESLDAIGDLKVKINKDLITKLSDILDKMVPVAKRMQTNRDGDYTQYDSKASSEWSDLSSEWRDAVSDWQSNFTKASDDAELRDEINDLGEYLVDKINGSKN